MTDNLLSENARKSYSDLIKEAYIDPIRSALIIDDNYPTWETVNNFKFRSDKKHGNTESAPSTSEFTKVVNDLKSINPALIIDTRRGISKEDNIEDTLHQSDLLVLDYHLKKNDNGEAACNIIRRLAGKQHFNMVILHTAEPNLMTPYLKIFKTLVKKPKFAFYDNDIENIKNSIIEIENSLIDKRKDKLSTMITDVIMLQYFDGKYYDLDYDKIIEDISVLKSFDSTLNDFEIDKNKKNDILKYYFDRFLNDVSNDNNFGEIKHGKDVNKDIFWIRTGRIFITFVKKYKNSLLDKLKEAIEHWGPSPSRLISSKLRTAIGSYGVNSEDIALKNEIAQFVFYSELLNKKKKPNGSELCKDFLERYVSIHMENLFDAIAPNMHDYALSIIENDKENNTNTTTNKYIEISEFGKKYCLPVDLLNENKAQAKYTLKKNFNAYLSIKAIKGWHLQCGHILKIDNDFWVCLSPACDLVPGQKTISHLTNIKPFTAVKLHKFEEENYSSGKKINKVDINSNNFIFLKDDNDIKSYCLYKDNKYGALTSEVFYAKNNGVLSDDDDIKCVDIISIGDKEKSSQGGGEKGLNEENTADIMPVLHSKKAQIIYQLRYEYALNLLQKFSGVSSRVGLDFSD